MMKTYEQLIEELKTAKTDQERQHIKEQIIAIKTYNDAYTFNAKEMKLLS